jgi:hypothetical protein
MARCPLFALALVPFAVISAAAQTLSPAGVVVVAQAAQVGNTTLTQGSTVFSGDLLRTGDKGATQVQVKQVRIALGGNSSMRIFRQDERIVVELEAGALTYAAPGAGENVTIFAQDVKFVPDTSISAEGQITVKSRCELSATAVRSKLEATSGRETRTIEESKSFSVTSEIGVAYQDSWQPVPADYPEFPRDAQYHHSHSHAACPATYTNQTNNKIKPPINDGHFREIATVLVLGPTIPIIIGALESPHKP